MNPAEQAAANVAYSEARMAQDRVSTSEAIRHARHAIGHARRHKAIHGIGHAFRTALILAPFMHCFGGHHHTHSD